MAKKKKSRTVTAKVLGAIPRWDIDGWMVRLTAPYLPFCLDSSLTFPDRESAEAEAEKWRGRTIKITITK